MTAPVREAAVAGVFYPGESKTLAREVDALLAAAPDVHIDGELIGLICPHAGYPYSGATAATGYRLLQNKPCDAVILIGPSHREPLEGASVFAHGGYETPLGIVPVHEPLATAIVANGSPDIQNDWTGHRVLNNPFQMGLRGEHALEVQIPFLQRTIPDLHIVPIVVGQYNFEMCTRIGNAIANAIGDHRIFIVISSDLYHGEDATACRQSDAKTLSTIETMDAPAFYSGIKTQTLQACGSGPILIALQIAKRLNANCAKFIARTNSNEATGRKSGYVVGYGTIAITR